jgi:RNA polymerase sigma factor (TIGR02999 family)
MRTKKVFGMIPGSGKDRGNFSQLTRHILDEFQSGSLRSMLEFVQSAPITEWLGLWSRGDESALEKLTPYVYEELRRLADAYLRNERSDHTLQATALVHEAYLRLHTVRDIEWKNRGQFVALAAQMMRRILVDYARRHSAAKRGDGGFKVPLDRVEQSSARVDTDLVALDEALKELATEFPRQAQVVELLFFGGLTTAEAAEVLTAHGVEISQRTIERDWRFARARLLQQLQNDNY